MLRLIMHVRQLHSVLSINISSLVCQHSHQLVLLQVA